MEGWPIMGVLSVLGTVTEQDGSAVAAFQLLVLTETSTPIAS